MKLMVALDNSGFAQAALAKALELAAPCKADLVMLSVVPNVGVVEEMPQKLVDKLVKDAEAVLAAAYDKAAKAGVAAETKLVRGASPADAILEAAEAIGCDMIVVGHRGATNLERFLIGSVARTLVAHATCSVLVVK